MNLTGKERILAGSRAYQTWRLAVQGSFYISAMLNVTRMSVNIFWGSRLVDFMHRRIMPLFYVDDYLDQPGNIELALVDNSWAWKRLKNLLAKISSSLVQLRGHTIVAGSFAGKNYAPPGTMMEQISLRRRGMALMVLYTLIYYPSRQVLLIFFPAADQYAGWAGGMVLGLFLAVVYLYLARNTGSDA